MNKKPIRIVTDTSHFAVEREIEKLVEEGYVPRVDSFQVTQRSNYSSVYYSIILELKDDAEKL